jgi:hypothetical protein
MKYIRDWDDAPSWDDCYNICTDDGEDCVYIGVNKFEDLTENFPRGEFWTYVSVDVNSASYCEGVSIVGPFDNYIDAVAAGTSLANEIADGWVVSGAGMETWANQIDAVMDAASIDEHFV